MRPIINLLLITLLLSSCASQNSIQSSIDIKVIAATSTSTIAPVLTPVPTLLSVQPSVPVGLNVVEREKIRSIMLNYGRVEEKYLTDEYWQLLQHKIDKYGEAKRITALEYHGNLYNMYNGGYSMSLESFESQMRYLEENSYHFVTGPEIIGFIEGWLKLPARSIILTTDSGQTSNLSLPSMTSLFEQLETEYGYAPHFISFIWTQGMTESETRMCTNDICWEIFRQALDSGYFTFGTHTESHTHFSRLSSDNGISDILLSQKKIQENLGVRVYSLSWPFEDCPFEYMDQLKDYGFKFGYGGWNRSLGQGYTYALDNQVMCLPRLFPPNHNGISSRPDGKNFEQMLDYSINSFTPLE